MKSPHSALARRFSQLRPRDWHSLEYTLWTRMMLAAATCLATTDPDFDQSEFVHFAQGDHDE